MRPTAEKEGRFSKGRVGVGPLGRGVVSGIWGYKGGDYLVESGSAI
jgi:hypothetical protein